MATFTPSLSAKVDKETKRSEILLRFCGGKGKVFRIKTRIFVAKEWVSTGKKFLKDLPTNPEAQKASTNFAELTTFLKRSFEAACSNPEQITKEWIEQEIDRFHNPDKYVLQDESKPLTLCEAISQYIAESPKRIQRNGKHVSPHTIQHLKQTQKHVARFLAEKRNVTDMEIKEVDKAFYNQFVEFLYELGFTLNTVGKHLKNIKSMINALPMAQRIECAFIDPKEKCVNLSEDIDNVYLTESELSILANCEIKTPYLDRVRDQFILLAWTGCRYSDLDKLRKENIIEISGSHFFKLKQQKTGNDVIIPIFPESQRILEKYEYNLPRPMANQKFNLYLKEVCKLAELDDEVIIKRTEGGVLKENVLKRYECISAHTARRSFATNLYLRGFDSMSIMQITGHKTESAFLTYIKVTREQNAARMMQQFLAQTNNKSANIL